MTRQICKITIIIVSYNTADLMVACLESVLASRRVECEVFVVDNASNDDSVEIIRKRFPEIRLIVNEINRGFGAANNQALRKASGEYIIFLNPDTTVEPESFFKMVSYMEEKPQVGLAGPIILNPDGTQQDSVSYRYPGHRYGAVDLGSLPGNIACVMGACQIASAELLRELGGFDEDFFLYGEDQDLCLRVRKRGLEIGHIDTARIMHHGGQSERTTAQDEIVAKKFRGELMFYHKHYRPTTVRKICNRHRRRAVWRIFIIRILSLLTPNKIGATGKLARYRAIRETIENNPF